MKKGIRVLSLALVFLMLVVSCASTTVETPVKSEVEKAKSYVFSMYNEGRESTATASDYKVVGVVTINGVTYDVKWSVDVEEGVTIVPSEDGKTVTVDVDEKTPKGSTTRLRQR